MGQHKNELNPFWKDGGTGVPTEKASESSKGKLLWSAYSSCGAYSLKVKPVPENCVHIWRSPFILKGNLKTLSEVVSNSQICFISICCFTDRFTLWNEIIDSFNLIICWGDKIRFSSLQSRWCWTELGEKGLWTREAASRGARKEPWGCCCWEMGGKLANTPKQDKFLQLLLQQKLLKAILAKVRPTGSSSVYAIDGQKDIQLNWIDWMLLSLFLTLSYFS